jgi:hypothetical protein
MTPSLNWLGSLRQRPVASAIAAAFVVLVAANAYLYRERHDAAQAHEESRRRGEAMVAFLADRPRIEADVAALRDAARALDDTAVREESKEVNLGYFYRLEKATRVRLNRIDQLNPEPPEPNSPYKSVPVSLRLTGTYRNLLAFIREIETGSRVMRVNSYQFERVSEGSDELAITLMIDMLARP